MWSSYEDMQTFRALSYPDKWRVSRCLVRGEAPADPAKARATIELAERYQRRGRSLPQWARWLWVLLGLGFGSLAVLNAAAGDVLGATLNALIAFGNLGHFLLNPILRPKNTALSLEASRRVAATAEPSQ